MPEQNFSNHVRRDPGYLALAVLNLTLIIGAIRFGGLHFHMLNWILLGLAIAVMGATAMTRVYALRNQNRIIRLEETIRLQHQGETCAGLNLSQIIALRFASDDEVAALVDRARLEQLTPQQIKQAIQSWRPDHSRV